MDVSLDDDFAGFELPDRLFDHRADTSKLRTDPSYQGFDNNCGDSWIYPTNYPVRQYQYDICRVALFRNTLVVLPTGLGKTFIAAVVMYNLYRWYPRGKVIFMAPTRPLVAQQIEACYQIMGIAKEDTAELTGKQAKSGREAIWRSKRVFYCTPQVLAADLQDSSFPVMDIKLIVVDEAHKARGKYAYNEVIRLVSQRNTHFRVLALSATPGRSVDDVSLVVRQLLISHIEVRSERSPDVVKYTHKKSIQTIVVKLDQELARARNALLGIIEPYVSELMAANVVTGSLTSLSKGWLIIQQKQFLDRSSKSRPTDYSSIMSNFAACISLYHGLELLEQHGFRIFLNFFEDSDKFYLLRDRALRELIDQLRQQIGANLVLASDGTTTSPVPVGWDFGHPKYAILREHLLRHFAANADTRALVFCEFRESVRLIEQLIGQNRPVLRPKVFVGRGSTTNGVKAITQKQQIAIMNDFRTGLVNVLIATCVAEEGIDVGEIDLIVCFDISTKNPTRFVQRIGRTGRRRDGCVLMLCTEGKEHRTLKDVLSHRDRTNQDLVNNQQLANIMQVSPRMVPSEFDPQCIETFIRIDGVVPLSTENAPTENGTNQPKEPGKTGVPKAKKCVQSLNTQDVRKFFAPIKPPALSNPPPVCTSPVYDVTIDYPDSSMSTSKSESMAGRTQPTPNEARVMQTVKKLRSLKLKLLRSIPATTKPLNINQVIRSAIAPQSLQRFALANNIPYLESQLPTSSMPLQKGGTLCIDDLFGGAENLRSFVKSQKSMPKRERPPLKELQLNSDLPADGPIKFEALDKKWFPVEQKEDDVVENEITVEPTQNTQMPLFIESESRYASYVDSPVPTSAKAEFASSTPLSVRTINATKQRRKKSPRSALKKQTPIKQAFQQLIAKQVAESNVSKYSAVMRDLSEISSNNNSIEVRENQSNVSSPLITPPSNRMSKADRSSTTKPSNLPEILRFFRLDNVLDIFAAEETAGHDLYVGSLDDIFVSDDDDEENAIVGNSKRSTDVVVSQPSSSDSDFEKTPVRNRSLKIKPTTCPKSDENITINRTGNRPHQTPKRSSNNTSASKCFNNNVGNRTARDISDLFADSFTIEEDPIVELNRKRENDDCQNRTLSLPSIPEEKNSILRKVIPEKPNDLYIGSLDDIFLSDEDEIEPNQLPINIQCKNDDENRLESDDSIPASQSSSPQRLCRTISSKLAMLSQKLKRQPLSTGAQPLRQISADMFEVSKAISLKTDNSEELSSSLKENGFDENSEKKSLARNEESPRRTVEPLADITSRSPSLLATRMSFSRLVSMSRSQKTGSLDLGRFQRELRPNCQPDKSVKVIQSKVELSSSDDDDFERNSKIKPTWNPPTIPATQEPSPIRPARSRNAKRFISSSSSSDNEDEPKNVQNTFKKPRITQRSVKPVKPCTFLDRECGVSGSESDDEDCEETAMLADLIDDDAHDTTNDTTAVDMQAIYMQSVRSPIIHRAANLASRRPPPDVSFIFSQAVEPDVDDYGGCSFVVNDDDDDDEEPVQTPGQEQHLQLPPLNAMCPLERAEFILKQRRRAKRLGIQLFSDEEALSSGDEPARKEPPRKKQRQRRRVISLDSSEDDN